MSRFVHLHVHTQYSILDGASSINGIVDKATKLGMKSVAITDHGNMFGIKEFLNVVAKVNESIFSEIRAIKDEIESKRGSGSSQESLPDQLAELEEKLVELQGKIFKPIVGCEAYIASNSRFQRTEKDDRGGDHLVLLAKNKEGYHNLVKLVSYSWTEGFYYKPRMDKELLRQYSKGIIASSACLGGEIPQAILSGNLKRAEELVYEYKEIFGDDFYLEVMLHPVIPGGFSEDTYQGQLKVNKEIFELSAKTRVKCIATNDVHFVDAEDAQAHDRLICINTAKEVEDPNRLHYTMQEFLKSEAEMHELFPDHPEAIYNTLEVADKVEVYSIDHEPIMPHFELPKEFPDENGYLRHLTYKGATARWGENLSNEISERIDFELSVIARMGYPSYFLIVWDFLKAAREMGVSVGPGRGSAAGSVVAYCLRITDIDPIKYELLFERFLNPERISMPDIDIDFDEDGREDVLKWVVNKYGKQRVAHIITFGTMAAKMAIRDVARVQKLPLPEADRLAKLVPERPGITLSTAYKESPELLESRKSGSDLVRSTLQYAEFLEGSIRQTGVHACGIIIGRDNLEEHIPICTAKDTELNVTQYDGTHVESVGLLKMDFLGLKTLSIIKDAVEIIRESKGDIIDIDNLPLDDTKTYELYSRGETTGLFQFESATMRRHLRNLVPNRFEDLIAMNALYRPGPMDYIPSYINRKHGFEEIEYDIPEMEEFLGDTYGITVYQEQVMLLSQKLAGFTKGEADSLRKAMGKKKKSEMDKLNEKFISGCQINGYDKKKAEKVWGTWESFAQYAFNKSHSTCYALVSYQTAYLKAHYPSEYMAAVLSRNLSDIKKITLFMDECKRMGIQVLGPDVNHSNVKFTVMPNGDIRFGLAAIKGVGEAAVANIVEVRKAGMFKDIFDFVERVNIQAVNKKSIEALVLAGALDNLGDIKRSYYFAVDEKGITYAEQLMRYGSRVQQERQNVQQTLFGAMGSGFELKKPEIPNANEWPLFEKLKKEKEVIGIFLSAHPLDSFKFEIDSFCNVTLSDFESPEQFKGKELTVAGVVSSAKVLTAKNGNHYGRLTIEDFSTSFEITLFGKDFENNRKYFYNDYPLLVKGSFKKDRFKEDLLVFNVTSISMLSEVRDELIKKLTVNIMIDDLTTDIVDSIDEVVSKEKGKVLLNFRVIDAETKTSLGMFSRSVRVNITNELIAQLKKLPVSLKVN